MTGSAAGVHVPPEVALAIVNATDKDEKVRLYNECINAGMTARDENDQIKEWDREDSGKRHKKNGAKVSESILEKHGRWQDEADDQWSHRPGLAKDIVALKSDNEDWEEFAYPEAANLPGIQFKRLNIRRMDDAKRRESIAKLEEVLFGS